MNEEVFLTKGDKDKILSRVNQVNKITIYCPMRDKGVQKLLEVFFNHGNCNYDIENLNPTAFGIHKEYAINYLVECFKICESEGIDNTIISVISGSLTSFKKMKYINFEFTFNADIYNAYLKSVETGGQKQETDIFKVEELEINLSEMFNQNVIDIFNRILIMNEIISNSYLDRKFVIDFEYDEYVSFVGMVVNNNEDILNRNDENVCKYFSTFPSLVVKHKPKIKLITNYGEI